MYKFSPILRPMIWGSELWVLSGYADKLSVVSEGPEKGKTVNDVYGGEFPLLIKFIDAHDDLSIQVHPDEELAQKRHGGHGKTEMWYVIDAKPDGHLLAGLSKSITPEEYVTLVEQNRIVDVLADHKIKKGDVFFLPAGRVHAICGGTYIAEIQQTSDITYRIYDYGRKGADGQPRQLHTEQARDAIDYKVYDEYRTPYEPVQNKEIEVVRCPYFTTSVFDLTEPVKKDLSDVGRFLVLISLEGEGDVNGMHIGRNETILIPSEEGEVTITPCPGGLKLLSTHI